MVRAQQRRYRARWAQCWVARWAVGSAEKSARLKVPMMAAPTEIQSAVRWVVKWELPSAVHWEHYWAENSDHYLAARWAHLRGLYRADCSAELLVAHLA